MLMITETNRHVFASDLVDAQGRRLHPSHLKKFSFESRRLNCTLSCYDMLNLKPSLVKPLFDEVSRHFTLATESLRLVEDDKTTVHYAFAMNELRRMHAVFHTLRQVWKIRRQEWLDAQGLESFPQDVLYQ